MAILGEQQWPRLIVRGLYRYEHAGFKGVFVPGAPVLEWCDMEKRAIAAAIEAAKEIAESDGYYPHSLSWELGDFIGDWKKYGYEQALRKGDFSKEDAPARYVYPERIRKRGFLHGVF